MNLEEEFTTYGTQTMTFGDKPAAAIAATAMRKTAEIFQHIDENAANKIKEDKYVDDIATGDATREKIEKLKAGITNILSLGTFQTKGFVTSGDSTEEARSLLGSGTIGRVLGIGWDPGPDEFVFNIRINLSKKVKGIRKEKDLELADLSFLTERRSHEECFSDSPIPVTIRSLLLLLCQYS